MAIEMQNCDSIVCKLFAFRLSQAYSQEKWTIPNEVLGVEQGSEVPAQDKQCVSKC